MELEQKVGKPVVVPILADVLEMKDEAWRGAVEGYLNTQKFYLLVDPACYCAGLIEACEQSEMGEREQLA